MFDHYLPQALHVLTTWQSKQDLNTPIYQMHGSKDRTFPLQYIKAPDVIINEGDHIMGYILMVRKYLAS